MSTFYSFTQKALRVGADTADGGRLHSSVPLTIAAVENPGDTRSVPASYELFGPGDVVRLAPGTIRRRFPMPGTPDAEYEKRAHVELRSDDLPWRYTPKAALGDALRPWLVLVVGQVGPAGIGMRPDGRVGLGTSVQATHPLAGSSTWAHLHEVGSDTFARVLSPAPLAAGTSYVACLVPAFSADGSDAWSGAAPVVVDCYDSWSFSTSELGDFPDLAGQLHKADLAAIEAASGKPFGRAEVVYHPRDGVGPDVTLETMGALRRPLTDPPGPADQPPDPAVTTEVSALTERLLTPDGRGVVTAPRYDAAFVTDDVQANPADGGWVAQLRSDPRSRGDAGLGSWNAIEWQDRIAAAAATKAADLAVARDRVRHVALGIEASRSVWRRRVGGVGAASDADAATVLDLLGPVLGRLPADSGGTVLDRIEGRTPRLSRVLFSSAARRALRPGPARTARAAEGAGSLASVLLWANRCEKPGEDPADLHPVDVDRGQLEEATKGALFALAPDDPEAVDEVMDRLFRDGRRPSADELAAAVAALAPGKDGHPDRDAVERFLNSGDQEPMPGLGIGDWPGWVDEHAHPEPCEPVDLVALAHGVAGAVDPTVGVPPAAKRVLSTLPGVTGVGVLEVEPELDLPLWSFLSGSAPNWMLPGAGDLTEGDVVGLATNPPFVQALLAGANNQTTGELRWRNIAMSSRWTPLRKFWQRDGGALDITPIRTWPQGQPLGGTGLATAEGSADAVVAFKTPLFRRYPATVVYLYPGNGWIPPLEGVPLTAGRVDHTFTGTIGDDITFFGFDVPPSVLADHWVVLEEPPTGYRFYAANQLPANPDTTASEFALNRFALPVRVLIGPLL